MAEFWGRNVGERSMKFDLSYQRFSEVKQLSLFPPSVPTMLSAQRLLGDIGVLQTLSSAGQRFACLYADPPWQYTNTATRAAAQNHYGTLTLADLCQLPIATLATPNAHLHLWTTNAMLPDALALMQHWGFTYKTVLVWCKPQIGIGNYWRNATELLLLGIRGSLPFRHHGQRNWVIQSRGRHSRKPDQIRHMIEQVSPPAYLELFAREATPGWVAWGNAIEPTLFESCEKESTP